MTREPIYQALFDLLSTASVFNRASRKLPHWECMSSGDQPALFVVQKHESPVQQTNFPPVWRLTVDVYLYARSSDENVPPSSILNPLIDAVCNVLRYKHGENQTLCGLVDYARIAGSIETDEGLLGDQSVVIIPVEMLTVQTP